MPIPAMAAYIDGAVNTLTGRANAAEDGGIGVCGGAAVVEAVAVSLVDVVEPSGEPGRALSCIFTSSTHLFIYIIEAFSG